jgi:zinc transporter ZupT
MDSSNPVWLAFLASLACWGATAAGAALVFLVPRGLAPRHERLVLDVSLGFAAGVMLAASFFGLMMPALERAQESKLYGDHSWSPLAIGLLAGAAFVHLTEHCLPHGADEPAQLEATVATATTTTSIGVAPSATTTPHLTNHAQNNTDARSRSSNSNQQLATSVPTETPSGRRHADSNGAAPTVELHEVKIHLQPAAPPLTVLDISAPTKAEAEAQAPATVPDTSAAAVAVVPAIDPSEAVTTVAPLSEEEVAATSATSADEDVERSSPTVLSRRSDSWRRLMLLVIAVTLHNFPVSHASDSDRHSHCSAGRGRLLMLSAMFSFCFCLQEGLGVGVAFGALASAKDDSDGAHANDARARTKVYANAVSLALAIGLQDFVG